MRMVDDLSEVTFWATNTKGAEKIIADNHEKMTDGMTDNEKKAFDLGVDNAFYIVNQLLTQGLDNESLTFYHPSVEKTEEFNGEEVLNWLETLPEN